MNRFFQSMAMTALIAGLALTGCDTSTVKKENSTNQNKSEKTAEGSARQKANDSDATDATGRMILEACIAKYKSLKSYEDRGILKLRIPTKEHAQAETEAMRIAFEFPNKLAIQAIDLQAKSSGNSWEAVVGKNNVKPFGSQRLVRPLPSSFDLKWLIVDNLGPSLESRATGSPIQLQLLFDEKPLAYLLEPESKITLLSPEVFDAAKCHRVQVVSKDFKWVFWIDQENKLLRKYELPIELIEFLVPGLPTNLDRTKTELSIELLDAKADSSVDWSAWKLPMQSDDILVRRFIDAPPRNMPPLVGKELKPFDLRDADGKVILDSAQRTKSITILCWVTNDEVGERFVKYLMEIQRELDKRLVNKAEIILVTLAKKPDMQESLKRWNCSFPLAIDSENLTRSLFSIQNQSAVVILDKSVRVQHFDEFSYLSLTPDLVEDLHRGVNVAARRIQDALHDEARFNSRLHRAMVDKNQVDKLGPIESFPFTYHSSKEAWNVSFTDAIIAAGGEHFYPQTGRPDETIDLFANNAKSQRLMTVLDELGHVYLVDNLGTKNWIANIPIDQADNAKRIHVLPDPWTHRWIAIIPEGLPRYWLIEAPLNLGSDPVDATQFDLDENESPVAFAWTARGNKPSLTIATSAKKVRVLDPQLQKRWSAESGEVVSIVPTINDRGEYLAWNVVETSGQYREIEDLPSDETSPSEDASRNDVFKLPYAPEKSEWAWGRSRNQGVLLGMAQLPSGETGSIFQSRFFEPKLRHPLSVRPEQCRIHSTATLLNGSLYWLATAPNRVLHLQTVDGIVADQMSLGKRIVSAGLFPDKNHLRIVLAVDNEVNCWSVLIPQPTETIPPASGNAPARIGGEVKSPSEQPSA